MQVVSVVVVVVVAGSIGLPLKRRSQRASGASGASGELARAEELVQHPPKEAGSPAKFGAAFARRKLSRPSQFFGRRRRRADNWPGSARRIGLEWFGCGARNGEEDLVFGWSGLVWHALLTLAHLLPYFAPSLSLFLSLPLTRTHCNHQ